MWKSTDRHGVVSHTGSAVLRLIADNTGLTGSLSRALARRGLAPVHDRGRVLGDVAVCIADGGRVLSDLAALRDQPELYGPVASDPTAWRTLEAIGERERVHIAAARARVRRRVWALISDRVGRIPPSKVAACPPRPPIRQPLRCGPRPPLDLQMSTQWTRITRWPSRVRDRHAARSRSTAGVLASSSAVKASRPTV